MKVCTHLTANLENSAGATGLENSVFIPVPKKGKECQRMPKNAQTTTQLHSSQMLANNAQNSPSRLEQYMNRDFPDLQVGFRKGRGPEIKLPTSAGSSKKQERSRKKIYFCFIDYAKAFNCVGHNKLWKILKEMGIPDHLSCPMRNLYEGQKATLRTGHGTYWFQLGKGGHQGCILSPCLFNLYRGHHEKCWAG